MKKIYYFALGILLMASANMWAGTYTLNVSAVPAGGGKVYASESSTASLDNCTQSTSTVSKKLQSAPVDYTLYAYAKADDDFRFIGWKETNSEDAPIVSEQAVAYGITATIPNTGETRNRYAFFERIAARFADGQTAEEINTILGEADGKVMEELTITRPIYRNTFYNTLCLPFDMDAAQIAASPLAGAEIKAFTGASVVGDELQLNLSPVSEIEAGKPYFIKFSAADALSQLDFEDVTVDASTPEAVTFNGVTLQGTFEPFAMSAQGDLDFNGGYIFLGQNNQLYWPNEAGSIKPFRAYFIVNTSGAMSAPIRRGMPAIFNETNVATGMENIQGDKVQRTKVIENGQFFILYKGTKYNVQGQVVK